MRTQTQVERTPGPWKAQQGTSYLDEQRCWMVPGVAHCGNGPCSEANARLIAAAPDLLAACKVVDGFYKPTRQGAMGAMNTGRLSTEVSAQVREAIAAAEPE